MKKRYAKTIIITSSVLILDLVFGFDWKFTIINLIWLLPFEKFNEKNTRIMHRE